MFKSFITLFVFVTTLGLQAQVQVIVPQIDVAQGESFSVDITVDDLSGLSVESYNLQLAYDDSLVTLTGAEFVGTLSNGANVQVNPNLSGLLVVVASTTAPLSGSGVLVRITGVANALGQSTLTLQNMEFNEGSPSAQITHGGVTVNNPDPLVITSQPQPASLCTGADVALEVAVTGAGPITYQWRRDGVEIPSATGASLDLTNLGLNDAGAYDCLVANPWETVTSVSVAVAVHQGPEIVASPQAPPACAGQDVSLSVVASGVNLSYQWRKDGVDLPGETAADLVLNNLEESDEGVYSCQVMSDCGDLETAGTTVFVDEALAITTQPLSSYVELGESHTLSVDATGAQPISYQWFLHGEPIPNATGKTLSMNPVRFEDSGWYYCRVSNPCGSKDSVQAFVADYRNETFLTQGTSNLGMGQAVVIAGDLAFVSRHKETVESHTQAGAVYVYQRSKNWQNPTRLTATNEMQNGHFGYSLDVYDNKLIVGAPGEGAMYIYRFEDDEWFFEVRRAFGGIDFGRSVALGEDFAVVGAPNYNSRGSVYLFRFNGSWQDRTVTSPSAANNQDFGFSVDIDGSSVVVGIPEARDSRNLSTGGVVVYNYNGSTLIHSEVIFPDDANNGDYFGYDVAIESDLIIASSLYDDDRGTNSGSVYAFRNNGGWQQEYKFTSLQNNTSLEFGYSVELSGNNVLIGNPATHSSIASVEFFSFESGNWIRTGEIKPKIIGFGRSVSLDGDLAMIGVHQFTTSMAEGAYIYDFTDIPLTACPKPHITHHPKTISLGEGQSHVFEVSATTSGSVAYQWFYNGSPIPGETTSLLSFSSITIEDQGVYHCEIMDSCDMTISREAALTIGDIADELPVHISELETGDELGPVAISGNRVMIGAPGDDDSGGAVYIYIWNGFAWIREAKINAFDDSGDFGEKVAISGIRAVISSGSKLHVYHLQFDQWVHRGVLSGSDNSAVAIQNDEIVIGNEGTNVDGRSFAGKVLVYKWNGAIWFLKEQLTLTNPSSQDRFGATVAISGDFLFAGMGKTNFSGTVRFFKRRKGTWQLEGVMDTPDFLTFKDFGSGLAVSGNLLGIGAAEDDVGGSNAGSIYLYEYQDDEWGWMDKLSPGSNSTRIGLSMDLEGTRLLLGSRLDNSDFLFELIDEQWTLVKEYTDPDGETGHSLGTFVALQGGISLLGAPNSDAEGLDSGKVLLFSESDTAQECSPGDVTFNGGVTAYDAAQVLSATVGVPTEFDPIPLCAGDVTCNGAISAYDAAQILRFTVGLLPDLNCVERSHTGATSAQLTALAVATGAVPFMLPLQWRGDFYALSFDLVYDPESLVFQSIREEIGDWLSVVGFEPGRVRVSLAGALPLGDQALDLDLQFLPLALGDTEVRIEAVTVDEVARVGDRIPITVSPCRGSYHEALTQWPQVDVRHLVDLLDCRPAQ